MNSLLRHSLIVFSLAVICSSAAVEVNGQNILGNILSRMDNYNKSLQSLQADVTMVKYNPQLNVSDTSVGTTSYLTKSGKRPMYTRIDWVKPAREEISVIGDEYTLFRHRLNQVIKGKVDRAKNSASAGGALSFMSMSRAQLRANFDIQYVGEANIMDAAKTLTWHLKLTPKVRTSYQSAELWVDGDGAPRQAKITEHNNDTTTILLQNLKKNGTLKAEIFRINYPKNAKIIPA